MIKYIKILVITIILGLLIGGCSTSLNVSVDDASKYIILLIVFNILKIYI